MIVICFCLLYFRNGVKENVIKTSENLTTSNSNKDIENKDKTVKDIQSSEVDLNGDGIKDKIKFEPLGDKEELNGFRLEVNNLIIERSAEYLDGSYSVVDIDTRDKYKEIVISEFGPSDDELTYFYYYNGIELIFMGELKGLHKHIKMNGKGILETFDRNDFFGTLFYQQEYRLTNQHKFTPIPKDMYDIKITVTIKQLVPMRDFKNRNIIIRDLEIGEKIEVISTDFKEWFFIRDSANKEGWFCVEDIKRLYGEELYYPDIFDGVVYAD